MNENNIIPKERREINLDSIRDNIILQNLSDERRLPETLKYLGKYCMESLTPDRAYALDIVENIEKEFPLPGNFAFKIIQIYTCAAYSKVFYEKLQSGFYNARIIPTLPYESLLEGESNVDIAELEKQINENKLKLLEYANYLERTETAKYYQNYQSMSLIQRFFEVKRMLKRSSGFMYGLCDGFTSGAMLGANIGANTGFLWGGPTQLIGMITGMIIIPPVAAYVGLFHGRDETKKLMAHYRQTFGSHSRAHTNAGI